MIKRDFKTQEKSGRKTNGLRCYLSNECLVLLHQLIQVLLVLLHPLQEVHLLMMQQNKLLIYLEDEVSYRRRCGSSMFC